MTDQDGGVNKETIWIDAVGFRGHVNCLCGERVEFKSIFGDATSSPSASCSCGRIYEVDVEIKAREKI